MKLIELRLLNFKGLRDFAFRPEGRDANVYGDNKKGKTTLKDSFLWLFFGKDSRNQKEFDIKTQDENRKPIPAIDHEVSGKLELDSGKKPIELRRVYYEKYTKKRGTTKEELTGHTTDYYVDGIPYKEKEYKEYIDSIIDENTFRLLVDPFYFSETIPWKERRKLLFEITKESVDDKDVFDKNSSLSELADLLNGRSVDDYKKMAKSKQKAINEEFEKIPIQIAENDRSLANIPTGQDASGISTKIADLRSDMEKRQKDRLALVQGHGMAEKEEALAQIKSDLTQYRLKYETELNKSIFELQNQLNAIENDTKDIDRKYSARQTVLDENEDQIDRIDAELVNLREEWHRINAMSFAPEISEICPTCGQNLPEDQMIAAREKAISDFNKTKSESLEKIQAKGKSERERMDKLKAENEALKKAISDLNSQKMDLEKKAADLDGKIDALRATREDYVKKDEYFKMLGRKGELETEISKLKEGDSREAVSAIDAEIKGLNEEIAKIEETQAQIKQSATIKSRIDDLKRQEKTLAKEYQRLEKELSLIYQFTETKCRMIEEKVNDHFKLANFKLFIPLINGGVEECCEVTDAKGVSYSSGLSNSEKINIGLDIINTLAGYYEFSPPIFVDNAESITDIIPTKGQQIRLYVSANQETLKVLTS